jgi:hypothetical protein
MRVVKDYFTEKYDAINPVYYGGVRVVRQRINRLFVTLVLLVVNGIYILMIITLSRPGGRH